MLDHSWHVAELTGEGVGIADLAEAAIEDVVVFVREVRLAVGVSAKFDFRAEGCDFIFDQRSGEFDYFYWQGKFAKYRDSLTRVNNDYEFFCG